MLMALLVSVEFPIINNMKKKPEPSKTGAAKAPLGKSKIPSKPQAKTPSKTLPKTVAKPLQKAASKPNKKPQPKQQQKPVPKALPKPAQKPVQKVQAKSAVKPAKAQPKLAAKPRQKAFQKAVSKVSGAVVKPAPVPTGQKKVVSAKKGAPDKKSISAGPVVQSGNQAAQVVSQTGDFERLLGEIFAGLNSADLIKDFIFTELLRRGFDDETANTLANNVCVDVNIEGDISIID